MCTSFPKNVPNSHRSHVVLQEVMLLVAQCLIKKDKIRRKTFVSLWVCGFFLVVVVGVPESFQTRPILSLWLLFSPHKPTLSFAASLSRRRFNLYKALDNCSDNFSLPVYEIIKGTFPSPGRRAGFSQAAVDDSDHSFCAWERSWSLAVPCGRVMWCGLGKKKQFYRNHWSCNTMKRIFQSVAFKIHPCDSAGGYRVTGARAEQSLGCI